MDDTGPLTLLMNFLGPIVIGLAIAAVLFYTWNRRRNPAAQTRSDLATERLYDRVENERRRTDGN